ncbi:hypothetical protein [Prevotella communis]|nr:hypothetical protein [Prevotella communis]
MTFLLALLTSVGTWATGGTPAGSGTSSDPYVIADAADWTTFTNWINNSNGTYGSKCYKLGADITISSMADTVLKTKLFGLKVRHFNNPCLLIAFTRSIHALFSM